MALRVTYGKHPSSQELNELLDSSKRNQEVSRSLHVGGPTSLRPSVSTALSFAKGILFGASIASTFIKFFDLFRGFWGSRTVTPVRETADSVVQAAVFDPADPHASREELMVCRFDHDSGAAGESEARDCRDHRESGEWSLDSRWEQAREMREIGDVFKQGTKDHGDEANALRVEGRYYAAYDELIAGLQDRSLANRRYTEANRIENEIAQDAYRGSDGCVVC